MKRDSGIKVSNRNLTVEELIEDCVKFKTTFMLTGFSGIGKTERVKQVDPTLTALTLSNGMLPEDAIGKTIFPTSRTPVIPAEWYKQAVGENDETKNIPQWFFNEQNGGEVQAKWIPPAWYNDLVKKCNAEPDRTHVLFIDEITNVSPHTQSLVYHIALNKTIAHGLGPLPENCVVALAGNSVAETKAARGFPSTLFRRVKHIDIPLNEMTMREWLKWGSKPYTRKSAKEPLIPGRLNIHPLVSAFVASRGLKAFYTKYDDSDPEIPEFALDPRRWAMVSDTLYNHKDELCLGHLEMDLGSSYAKAFLQFIENPPLTYKDIVRGFNVGYDADDIPKTPLSSIALTYALRDTPPKYYDTVRQFIETHLQPECGSLFEAIWNGNNDDSVALSQSMGKMMSVAFMGKIKEK